MSEDRVEPQAVHGGQAGHWLRRATHLLLAGVPVAYYDLIPYLQSLYPVFPAPVLVALLVGGVLLLFEALRLRRGIIVIGQRHYERARISGAAWSIVGGLIVLLGGELLSAVLARALAYPVFFAAAVVDPIAGELRRRGSGRGTVVIATLVCAAVIWAFFCFVFDLPLLVGLIAVLVTAAVEGPRTSPIDDNLTLLLLPWLAALTCHSLLAR